MYFFICLNTKNIKEHIPQIYLTLNEHKPEMSSLMYHIKRSQHKANYLQMSIIFPCMTFTAQKIRHIGGLH